MSTTLKSKGYGEGKQNKHEVKGAGVGVRTGATYTRVACRAGEGEAGGSSLGLFPSFAHRTTVCLHLLRLDQGTRLRSGHQETVGVD